MNTKQHIDLLFSSYEETDALTDFKEELESNLNDRINSLRKKGFSEQAAFDKAIGELGDVSAIILDWPEICLGKPIKVMTGFSARNLFITCCIEAAFVI